MASVALINAVIFGVYGDVKRRMADPDSLRSQAIAGSAAGLVQSVVCSPMELIKTRIQIQEHICAPGTQLYKYDHSHSTILNSSSFNLIVLNLIELKLNQLNQS